MEYVVYASGVERWALDCWVGNPLKTPRVICRAAGADSKPRRLLVRTTTVSSKFRKIYTKLAQSARNGTSSREARNYRWDVWVAASEEAICKVRKE
jgi:hypothetical protein